MPDYRLIIGVTTMLSGLEKPSFGEKFLGFLVFKDFSGS